MATNPTVAVSSLMSASDLPEVAAAASDVLDLALEGGCAVSESAPEVISLIDRFGARATVQGFLLSVLINVGRWIGAWRSVASGDTPDELVAAGVRWEAETSAALIRLARHFRESPLPADPEERGLVFRLTGVASDDPENALAWLVGAADEERSPDALGCAVEAALVLSARFSALGDSASPWVRRQLAGPYGDEIRVRLAVAPHDFVGQSIDANRQLIETLASISLPTDEYAAMWPSELL